MTLCKHKRFLGDIRKCNLASHNSSAIRIVGDIMRSGKHAPYPPESGVADYNLRHWKSPLSGNNPKCGASFGKLQLYSPSFWKAMFATLSKVGPCTGNVLVNPTVSFGTTWIFDSTNHFDIHSSF